MADVITVTSGTAGSAGNVAADLQTYFAANLLEVAELNTVMDQFGEKVPLPSNSSKTIHFVQQITDEYKFCDMLETPKASFYFYVKIKEILQWTISRQPASGLV